MGDLSKLLECILPVLRKYSEFEADGPIFHHRLPSQLRGLFPQNLSLPEIGLRESPDSELHISNLVSLILQYSVRTNNAGFLDKLYSGSDAIGQLSELVVSLINTNVHVFSVSPVATLMELECIEQLAKQIGFSSSCGVFQPGGSASNFLAMTTARSLIYPDIKRVGAVKLGLELSVFTSIESHYSIQKSAIAMGLGTKFVISVETGSSIGSGMSPLKLRDALLDSRGRSETPFFVNLTAGTTVLSAFDPISECIQIIRAIESELNLRIWVHVDGSYGGPAVFSPRWHAQYFSGVQFVDSFAISPHKILGIPQQCSCLIVNTGSGRWPQNALWIANGLQADYLFHEPRAAENHMDGEAGGNAMMLDLGDATIGCGRRPDAVKLFLSWSFHGTKGFRERVDKAFANVDILAQLISQSPWFQLVIPYDQLEHYAGGRLSVSFWFVAREVKTKYGTLSRFKQIETPELTHLLIKNCTIAVHSEISRRGNYMIDYMGLKSRGLPEFMRVCLSSEAITPEFLENLVRDLESICETLQVNLDSGSAICKNK